MQKTCKVDFYYYYIIVIYNTTPLPFCTPKNAYCHNVTMWQCHASNCSQTVLRLFPKGSHRMKNQGRGLQ